MSKTFLIQNGDWVVSGMTGRHQMVTDGPKLRQDVREDLSVDTQPSGFGAGIDALVGRVFDPVSFQLQLTRAIRQSVVAMQRIQDRSQAQQRPLTERIRGISGLTVSLLNGATDFAFRLQVSTLAGGPTVTAAGAGSFVLTPGGGS